MANMMRRYKLFLRSFFIVTFALVGLALFYAPYLPQLVKEGYPQLLWPAPGFFVALPSQKRQEQRSVRFNAISQLDSEHKLNDWSKELFEAKGGKALLVYHKGRLVVEHYAKGFNNNSRFNSYSMVKSLIGALVLKAVAEQKIHSLSDPIGRYLPVLKDKILSATPLQAFLGMKSGIIFENGIGKATFGARTKDIDGTKLNPFGPMVRLHMTGLDAILGSLRGDRQAQGHYSYQNINTALLGRVLSKVYKQPLDKLVYDKIWKPAQNSGQAFWRRYDKSKPVTPYCCFYARPKDWIKVGRFLMRNGQAAREPFLPKDLWRVYMGMDITADSFVDGRSQYGAHIYHNTLDRAGQSLQGKFTYMFGSRGQVLYMMPEKDLVVVRFGEQIQLLHSTLYAAWKMVKLRK